MRIGVAFIGWNIEDTIHLTINHWRMMYGVQDIYYLDNHSTDQSRDIAKFMGCNVSTFGIPGVLDDGEYVKVKNNFWKGKDYDYFIMCDDDEIIYHKDWSNIIELEKIAGTTIFKTQGYSMFSKDVPSGTFTRVNYGYQDDKYSKLVIFDPKAVRDINYVYGCHEAKPTGNLQWSHVTLPLYHYMGIGGPERMIARHGEYAKRLSPLNHKWGLGIEYTHSAESKRQWYAEQLKKSVPLF